MAFDHPFLLLAWPLLVVGVALLEARVPGTRARKALRIAARSCVLGLALVACAGPHRTELHAMGRRLVVAIDRSPRLPPEALEQAGAAALGALEQANAAGIAALTVDFDGEAATGLARARLALSGGETGGILLLTDGRGSLAGLRDAAAALRDEGLAVGAVPVPTHLAPAAVRPGIEALEVPTHPRGPFAVRAALAGPVSPDAVMVLRVDGEVVQRLPLAGESAQDVRFDELDLPAGAHEVGVTLESEADGAIALQRRLVDVGRPPRALRLVADATAPGWRDALAAQGLEVIEVDAQGLAGRLRAPGDLPDVLLTDAAGLLQLAPETAALLAQRVRDGLGLLLEPGLERTAWGRLAESPLAPLLPLRPQPEPPAPPQPMPPPPSPPTRAPETAPPEADEGPGLKAERRPEEALPITLLLLVDRSPSMEGAKLAMAVHGAQQAAAALSPWDRIGVITFADDVTLDVSPRSARGAASIPLWLSTVEAGGQGTNIAGALRRAREVLETERAPILHVILLTDGRQHPPGPIFGPIVRPMRERGITITAVGIGRGARMDQLRDIVQWAAGGMSISAPTPRDIPRILTRDTRDVAAQRSAEARAIEARLRPEKDSRPPRPPAEDAAPLDTPPPPATQPPTPPPVPEAPRLLLRVVRAHEAVQGLEEAEWPAVGRPLPSRLQAGGAVVLEREDGAPVLAAARAGLGRVLQWTLPPDDRGALGWPKLGRLWAQSARAVLAPRGTLGYLPSARVLHGPDGPLLEVDWPVGTSTGVLDARWVGPQDERAVGRFRAQDGRRSAPLPAAPTGALCRLELAIVRGPRLPSLSYLARELPRAPAQTADVAALEQALGGPLPTATEFVARLPWRGRPQRRERWKLWLWLAVALLPLDVALHRRGRAT